MAELTEQQQKTLRSIFERYDLTRDDIHIHKHYTILKRSAIEKIQRIERIKVTFILEDVSIDHAVVKAIGTKSIQNPNISQKKDGDLVMIDGPTNETTVETFGSASYKNTAMKYFPEVAEKRALSRCVLKMVDLYEKGIFSEDEEIDESKE